jgi:hypothetical protein
MAAFTRTLGSNCIKNFMAWSQLPMGAAFEKSTRLTHQPYHTTKAQTGLIRTGKKNGSN